MVFSPYIQTHLKSQILQLPYAGPFSVVQLGTNEKLYKVKRENGKAFWVDIDRTIPYAVPGSTMVAIQPNRESRGTLVHHQETWGQPVPAVGKNIIILAVSLPTTPPATTPTTLFARHSTRHMPHTPRQQAPRQRQNTGSRLRRLTHSLMGTLRKIQLNKDAAEKTKPTTAGEVGPDGVSRPPQNTTDDSSQTNSSSGAPFPRNRPPLRRLGTIYKKTQSREYLTMSRSWTN